MLRFCLIYKLYNNACKLREGYKKKKKKNKTKQKKQPDHILTVCIIKHTLPRIRTPLENLFSKY